MEVAVTSQTTTTAETTQKTTTQVVESTTVEPGNTMMHSASLNDDGSVHLEWKYDEEDITMKVSNCL